MSRELVEQAMRGKRDAFAVLIDRAHARMVGTAALILRDHAWAEDAAQDALVRAWRDLPSLRNPDRFDAWLHRLLVRACYDQLRRHRHELAEVELLLVSPSRTGEVGDPRRVEDRDEVERGLRHLTVEQRMVIALRYYLGLTDSQLAAATGLPMGTVKSRLFRALEALRAALAAEARGAAGDQLAERGGVSTRLDPDDLRQTEQRLISTLAAIAPHPQPGSAERVRARVAATAQRRGFAAWLASWAMARPRSQTAMAAAGVVLAVTVAVGIGGSGVFTAWRGSGTTPPIAGSSPIPSLNYGPSTAAPSPSSRSDSLAPSTLYTSVARARIPDPSPQTFGGESPRDVMAFQGGFVAVGGLVGTCCAGGYSPDTRGLVWLSRDGQSWELLPPQAALAHGYVASMGASDKLVVAVGHRSLPQTQPGTDDIGAASWWSSDGRSWHLATGGPTFSWVAERGGMFFAISSNAIGDEVWSSVDGRTWRKSANVADLGYSHLLGITTSGVGILAWGSAQVESANGSTKETGVVWTSADGASWVAGAGNFADAVIDGVAASPGPSAGLMAFGQRSDGRWAVWTSHDGATWTEADAPGTGDGAFLRAYATSRGFLLAGSEMGVGGSRLRLWSSTNGTLWSIVAADSEALRLPPGVRSAEITSFVEKADGSVIAVGSLSRSGLNGISAAWVIRP